MASVILAMLLTAGLKFSSLIRHNMRREMMVYGFYLLLALILAVPHLGGWPMLNPDKVIKALFQPLAEWLK